MREPKKRPGLLWMAFYGRQRRGFPWLLFWVATSVVLGALTFRLVGSADVLRSIYPILAGGLILAALALALAAWLRPRRRR